MSLFFSLLKQKYSWVIMKDNNHISKEFSDRFDFVQKERFLEGTGMLGVCVTGVGGS